MTRPTPEVCSQVLRSRRVLAALALLLVTSCATRTSESVTGSATAEPAAEVVRPRVALPPPAGAASQAWALARPSAVVPAPGALTPVASTASPLPTGPAILSAETSAAVLHAGDTVVWTVRTTPEIVRVTASTSLIKLDLPRRAPGLFTLPFTIPAAAPSFFHGNYSLSIVATDRAGRTATSSIALDFE